MLNLRYPFPNTHTYKVGKTKKVLIALPPRSLQVPEEIHKQYATGGRAEKAKLLQMFIDSGLDKALDWRQKPCQTWSKKLGCESILLKYIIVMAYIAFFP